MKRFRSFIKEGDPIVTKKVLHPGVGNPAPKGTIAYQKKHKLGVYAKGFMNGLNKKKKPVSEHSIHPTDDHHMAHELINHADNDERLYRSSHEPIVANLKRKMKKGVYDPEKAKKLWGYHADRAAQSYHKAYGDKSQKWHHMFPTVTRKVAAAHWEQSQRSELHEDFTDEQCNLIEDATEQQLDALCESETLVEYKSTSTHPELLKTHMLAHETTGKEIKIGSKVKGFRGTYHIKGFEMPHHAGSTGRVIVHDKRGAFGQSQYFPGVVNAKIVKRKAVSEGNISHKDAHDFLTKGSKAVSKKTPTKKKEKPFRDAAVTGNPRDFAKEEVERVDELSKKTLGKYIKRAVGRVGGHEYSAGTFLGRTDKASEKAAHQQFKSSAKRQLGIVAAVKKLTKEEVVNEKIGSVKKGQMHKDLGKSQDSKITSADIAKEKAKGGVFAKRATFAQNAKKWHHESVDEALAGKGSPHLVKLKKQYDENEDNNDHSTNAVLLAKHFGTSQEHATAKRHLADRDRLGYGSLQGSQFQADMSKKYYHKLSVGPLKTESVYDSATGSWMINELSKKTLKSYAGKASKDLVRQGEMKSEFERLHLPGDKVGSVPKRLTKKIKNRIKGIGRVVNKGN